MADDDRTWPGGRRMAIVFNICLEAWSDGVAPGISPMGNPLPTGLVDSMAISWAGYGVTRGIHRLLDAHDRHEVPATVLANAIIAERDPVPIRRAADGGHEVASHSYAMDVIPVMLDDQEERDNITRCTELLAEAAGAPPRGWLSPRATPSPRTSLLLAEAGYRWHGDALDTDLPYVGGDEATPITMVPFKTDINDMPTLKHGVPPRRMYQAFLENLAAADDEDGPLLFDVTTHAHICGHLRPASWYQRILADAIHDDRIWCATRDQVAAHASQWSG